jgi:hypothetical protein
MTALYLTVQIVGREALEALTTTVKRDFHDAETLRAALETLLVVFMYEEHPVYSLNLCNNAKAPSIRIALQKLQDTFIKVVAHRTKIDFRIPTMCLCFSNVWIVQIFIHDFTPCNCCPIY